MTGIGTYHKIETVFRRKDDFNVIATTEGLRLPEFGLINEWLFTEKVDGTNMRVIFWRNLETGFVTSAIRGKTDNAQIPGKLMEEMQGIVLRIHDEVRAIMEEFNLETFVLYGEGYGPKIQKGGGRYRDTPGFILFDVRAGGAWLDEDAVTGTAERLGLDRVPFIDGISTIWEAVQFVSEGYMSTIAQDLEFPAEGVIAKTRWPLYTRTGARLIWKLKETDFNKGKPLPR